LENSPPKKSYNPHPNIPPKPAKILCIITLILVVYTLVNFQIDGVEVENFVDEIFNRQYKDKGLVGKPSKSPVPGDKAILVGVTQFRGKSPPRAYVLSCSEG
jgi:hypothetical protein